MLSNFSSLEKLVEVARPLAKIIYTPRLGMLLLHDIKHFKVLCVKEPTRHYYHYKTRQSRNALDKSRQC